MNKEEMKESILAVIKEAEGLVDENGKFITSEELERCANELTEIAFAVKETSPVRPIAEDPDAALDAWRDQRATEYEAEQAYHEQQTKEGK